eukprot:5890454-Amphidinium_carterae.1
MGSSAFTSPSLTVQSFHCVHIALHPHAARAFGTIESAESEKCFRIARRCEGTRCHGFLGNTGAQMLSRVTWQPTW